MLVALLLVIDAEIARRWYVYGFHMSWISPEDAAAGHQPVIYTVFDSTVLTFFALLHAGLIWLFWQLRASQTTVGARLLHLLLGDKKIISTEEGFRNFKFTSESDQFIVFKLFGLLLIWISFDFVNLHPTREALPYQVALAPIVLLLWWKSGMMFLRFSRVEISDGVIRFCGFLEWTSVPLEAVTKVRTRWFGVDVTVQVNGERRRFYFYPNGSFGTSPPPVVQFLEEVCKRSQGKSVFQS